MPSPAHPRSTRILCAITLPGAGCAPAPLAAPVSAAPPQLQEWHRLNPFVGDTPPEHEQLACLPGVQWTCRYDKAPDPDLFWDRTIAMFHGRDITAIAECPTEEWFPVEVCDAAEQVIAGVVDLQRCQWRRLQDGPGADLHQRRGRPRAPVLCCFDFGFICPWYESFADAVAANPDASPDCVFAP